MADNNTINMKTVQLGESIEMTSSATISSKQNSAVFDTKIIFDLSELSQQDAQKIAKEMGFDPHNSTRDKETNKLIVNAGDISPVNTMNQLESKWHDSDEVKGNIYYNNSNKHNLWEKSANNAGKFEANVTSVEMAMEDLNQTQSITLDDTTKDLNPADLNLTAITPNLTGGEKIELN